MNKMGITAVLLGGLFGANLAVAQQTLVLNGGRLFMGDTTEATPIRCFSSTIMATATDSTFQKSRT